MPDKREEYKPRLEAVPTSVVRLQPDGSGEPAAPGYGDVVTGREADPGGRFREYVAVLYRRRWIAGTVFAMVVTLGVVYNVRAVSTYEATARVLVDPERLNLVNIEDVVSQQRSLDAELAILRSRWLARETVASLGLIPDTEPDQGADDAPVANGAHNGTPAYDATDAGSWWATAWAYVSMVYRPSPPPSRPADPAAWQRLAGESVAETREINGFIGGLSVELTAGRVGGVLDIRYRSVDPVQAAQYANAHANAYINQNLELRFAAAREVTEWLRERLAEQKQRLDASEQAVMAFRERHGLISATEGSSIAAARLNELSASITRAQASRLEKDAAYNRAMALRGSPEELDRLPQLVANPAIAALRVELERLERDRVRLSQSLRDAHPDMITLNEAIDTTQAKLTAERSRVVEAMRQDLATARAAENGLSAELERIKGEAAAQNRHSVELSILEREAQSNRQIYEMLTQRARETGVAREISPSRTRVLDPAMVPSVPVSPDKKRSLLQAVLLGLMLAVAVAFGIDRLDNRMHRPEDIVERLAIPFIGLIPEVKTESKSTVPLALNGISPHFSEELRRIRTNLIFSFTGDTLRTIVVTSAGPGEGKTTVACNLAVTLAETGERVLLVDADLRRPTAHLRFDCPQEPGLSNVLVGNTAASAAVRQTSVNGLWILAAGRQPPNPSELLGSHHFKRLLGGLADHFDWVILDTAPVMPVTDTCVLAHTASGVLFVAGAERVVRQDARRAVDQLLMANGKIVGGVLNRVALDRHRYYYGSYYREYSRPYTSQYVNSPGAGAAS